jgi:hypothetical protein
MKPKRYEGKDLKYCTELCSSTRAWNKSWKMVCVERVDKKPENNLKD